MTKVAYDKIATGLNEAIEYARSGSIRTDTVASDGVILDRVETVQAIKRIITTDLRQAVDIQKALHRNGIHLIRVPISSESIGDLS